MSNPQISQVEQLVTNVEEVIGKLRTEVSGLSVYGRHNRHLIKLVAFSVCFDIALSLGLGYGIHKANSAQAKANSATTVNCQAANETRKDITHLWGQVIPLLAKTDAEQSLKIKDYISTAYAQRDCMQKAK